MEHNGSIWQLTWLPLGLRFEVMKSDPPFVLVGTQLYRLFKRGEQEDSPWWIRIQHQGKRIGVSTSTADVVAAKKVAKKIAEEAVSGTWTAAEKLIKPRGGKLATLGQVLKLADAENGRRLVDLVTTATGKKDVTALSTDTLTRALAGAFLARMQGLQRPDYELPHENNGSANATLRHAKAVFSKKAMLDYESAGLNLPSLEGFLNAPELPNPKFRYSDNPPAPAKIRKVVEALPSLEAESPVLYRDLLKVALNAALSEHPKEHAAWLKPFGVTLDQLRWHPGAVWLRKTNSLKVVTEKLNISYGWAHWHYSQMKVKEVRLELSEL